MTVVLDLDDVLANLRQSLYEALHRVSGVDRHWSDWTHYDLRRHFPPVAHELDRVLIEQRALESCAPEPGAAELTRTLRARGVAVAIVTARGWHPQARELTRQWLHDHGIAFDRLDVVALGGNKVEITSRMEQVALAVDDHPAHVDRYRQSGLPVLMMDRPWNREHPHRPRIHHVSEILAYLQP